jgi:hypothetical protein
VSPRVGPSDAGPGAKLAGWMAVGAVDRQKVSALGWAVETEAAVFRDCQGWAQSIGKTSPARAWPTKPVCGLLRLPGRAGSLTLAHERRSWAAGSNGLTSRQHGQRRRSPLPNASSGSPGGADHGVPVLQRSPPLIRRGCQPQLRRWCAPAAAAGPGRLKRLFRPRREPASGNRSTVTVAVAPARVGRRQLDP